MTGLDVEPPPAEAILGPDADDAARLVGDEGLGTDPGRDRRCVGRGGARHVHGVERVVLLGVAEPNCPDQRLGPESGGRLERGSARQMPRTWEVPAGPHVVQEEAGAGVRTLPPPVPEWKHELHRPHEMGSKPREQKSSLAQGFVDELELQQLEVAKPAVDQLARPARRSSGQVALLDEPDRQSARGRIERGADTGDPAPDDEDVQSLPLQPGDRILPRLRVEGSPSHSSARTCTSTASAQRERSRTRPASSRLGVTRRVGDGASTGPSTTPAASAASAATPRAVASGSPAISRVNPERSDTACTRPSCAESPPPTRSTSAAPASTASSASTIWWATPASPAAARSTAVVELLAPTTVIRSAPCQCGVPRPAGAGTTRGCGPDQSGGREPSAATKPSDGSRSRALPALAQKASSAYVGPEPRRSHAAVARTPVGGSGRSAPTFSQRKAPVPRVSTA